MNDIDKVVDEKIGADADFQASLAEKTDEEKNALIEAKRKEVIKVEYASVSEKAAKNEELANNQKIRAEKAEGDVKKYKPSEKKEEAEDKGLSTSDFYALTDAKVPQADVETVTRYAKFEGISISDALKSPILTGILKDNSEKRSTAAATQTRSTRSTAQTDGNDVLQNMRTGGEDAIPARGSKEAEAAFWAKNGGKRK